MLVKTALLAAVAFAGYVVYLDYTVRAAFEGKRWALPARVYAQPQELYPGLRLGPAALERTLKRLGYASAPRVASAGQFYRKGDEIRFVSRAFAFWDGEQPVTDIRARFRANELVALSEGPSGSELGPMRLEPELIGSFYPAHNEDRILVRLTDVPPQLVQALIAMEDRDFYSHHGVSPKAILRALWANLRAGAAVQGGSTLTQQLVKNFYLSHERTLWRKFNEAIMALLLEWRYEKGDILEAYLNEVYLGQDGKRAIHGFGLASRFYFARPVDELDLAESSLLVALVRGASYYNPRRHPDRALARRNRVIDNLASLNVISEQEAAAARGAALGVTPEAAGGVTPYPAFFGLVRRQLRRDYRPEDLTSEGLRIFTTLNPTVQERAEEALVGALKRLERQRKLTPASLEGAVVVTDSASGEVQAVVGGRDPRYAGFNRAVDAARPVGSLIKPAVYLTALSEPKRYTLATLLDDSPLRLNTPDVWSPQNFDRRYHGRVPMFEALAQSYNVATVRLGLAVGIDEVIGTLHKLGITRQLPAYPSLFLGAVDLSPLEVAQMYQTIAGGGFRTPLRAIREVTDAEGRPLQRYPLRIEQAYPYEPTYLVMTALQEVVRRGTARALTSQIPSELAAAGKTGTTDELRDSWFAGFVGDLMAVVWVGRDDNQPAGLTGASGAMQVWGRLMGRLGPTRLYLEPPPAAEQVWIDPATGLRGDPECTGAVRLAFVGGTAPQQHAPCAGGRVRDTLKGAFDWFKGD